MDIDPLSPALTQGRRLALGSFGTDGQVGVTRRPGAYAWPVEGVGPIYQAPLGKLGQGIGDAGDADFFEDCRGLRGAMIDEVLEDGALSRRRRHPRHLARGHEGAIVGEGLALEAGWKHERDGSEEGGEIVFAHPGGKGAAGTADH